MNLKQFNVAPIDVDPNGIAEDQQPDTGTPFVLNGALCDTGTAGQFDISDSYPAGISGVRIGFESTGDWSGVTISVSGKDQDGQSVSEDITGPSNGTVESVTYWSYIPAGGITVSDTVATDIEAGTVDEVITKTVPINYRQCHDAFTTAVLGLSGTIQYDMQQTFEHISQAYPVNWIDYQSNKSADLAANCSDYATAVRLVVDSYSSGAELQYHVNGD